jgi:hypothetical protein
MMENYAKLTLFFAQTGFEYTDDLYEKILDLKQCLSYILNKSEFVPELF